MLLASREAELRVWGKVLAIGIGSALAVLVVGALSFAHFFGPARAEFIVAPEDTLLTVSEELEAQGLVRHAFAFRLAYRVLRADDSIRPGGYALASGMDTLAVAKKLGEAPYLSWVVIPEGRRKEEVADILMAALGWTPDQRQAWLAATNATSSLPEGVFYADIYLIPSDQDPAQVVERMRARFDEAVASFATLAADDTLSFNEVITLASIVEREAAGSRDS